LSYNEDLSTTLLEGISSQLSAHLAATSPSRWAENYRVMTTKEEDREVYGPTRNWSFKGREYLREIHDCKANKIILPKGAQIGDTESMINRLFFSVDIKKRDVLYVLPTAEDAYDFSNGRLNAAIELSSRLREIFTDVNNVKHKKAGHVNFYCRGARGKSQLKSVPVQDLYLDEYDEISPIMVKLAEERLTGSDDEPTEIIASTPSVPDAGVWTEWTTSRQHHYFITCPNCSKEQTLEWPDNIVWEGDKTTLNAWICCSSCKFKIEHEDKHKLIDAGRWRCTANEHADHYGFHVSQLYSCTKGSHPREIVRVYLDEREEFKIIFQNSKLGKPYIPEGAKITPDMVKALTTTRPVFQAAQGACMGIDVAVAGGMHYIDISEVTADGVKVALNIFQAPWEDIPKIIEKYRVRCCVIDAQPERTNARSLARMFPGRVYVAFYPEGLKDLYVANEAKQTVLIDRSEVADMLHTRIRTGALSLPLFPKLEEYAKHCSNIVKTYKPDRWGLPVARYVNTGPDHFAHSSMYCEIALAMAPTPLWTPTINNPPEGAVNNPGPLFQV